MQTYTLRGKSLYRDLRALILPGSGGSQLLQIHKIPGREHWTFTGGGGQDTVQCPLPARSTVWFGREFRKGTQNLSITFLFPFKTKLSYHLVEL